VREVTDEGYVVHRRRLRETSYVLQILTRDHGLFSGVMRGAARASKRPREIPSEFKLFHFAWSGKAEMPTILRAEPVSAAYLLSGDRLFCAIYLNELITCFLHRGDANDLGFGAYEGALKLLNSEIPVEPILRQFELDLLQACGYGMQLEQTADQLEIDVDGDYCYLPEVGPVSNIPTTAHRRVKGATLLALASLLPWTADTSREAKGLLRFVIRYHLGGRELHSRTLFKYSAPT
jgi:DNA repair protein RecO (recombination protein O)